MKGKSSFDGNIYKFYGNGLVVIRFGGPFPWTLTVKTLPRGK